MSVFMLWHDNFFPYRICLPQIYSKREYVSFWPFFRHHILSIYVIFGSHSWMLGTWLNQIRLLASQAVKIVCQFQSNDHLAFSDATPKAHCLEVPVCIACL